MKLYGIDFTSAPSPKKPMTCAVGVFSKSAGLTLGEVEYFTEWDEFEAFLQRKGPWFCGMDFPFGLPLEFLDKMSLPRNWAAYVRAIAKWKKEGFEKKILQYKKKRPKGEKDSLRITDMLANAQSPLKLVRAPVAKMFFAGASRLLKSGVSIIPGHIKNENRIVVEAYPALLARRFVAKYKDESSNGSSTKLLAERKKLVNAIRSAGFQKEFGFKVTLAKTVASQMVSDSKGDVLDAVLCAIQAAWSFKAGKPDYGIPNSNHAIVQSEGWIVDPRLTIEGKSSSSNRKASAPALSKNRPSARDNGTQDLMNQIKRLSEIGRALSGQQSLTSLLEAILTEARNLTHADGGTLYLREGNALHFMIVQNGSLNISMGGTHGAEITFPPVQLEESNVSAYVAMKGNTVNIPDVYHHEGFDFEGPKKFDTKSNYRTKSMLVVPMHNHEGEVIGVLQLLNAQDPKNQKKVIPFSADSESLVESLASQAAVAVSYAGLVSDMEEANFELMHVRDRALEANRAKSSFLANMSHELRTPMNAIIGYSEMLAEDARDQELAEFEADLGKINSAGKHLMALINDILDLSKIEAGKMDIHLENFSISELVKEVVATIKPLAEQNNNHIEVQCPENLGTMNADTLRIRQMLFNLLSNACKFTENGSIWLKITREPKEGTDWITFNITDTGIGISPYEIKNLFTEFTQIDPSNTRKFSGTGLGLAISQRFCRMMGGDITVQSKPDQGSTFSIHLPVKVTAHSHPLRRASDLA